jgi:HlyD family secretion protein
MRLADPIKAKEFCAARIADRQSNRRRLVLNAVHRLSHASYVPLLVVIAIILLPTLSLTFGAEAQGVARPGAERLGEKQWRAVAPGQIEPVSGEIKISAPTAGRVADVLVSAKDQVFAGELLVRLEEADARARLAKAQAQFAMQKRTRNDEAVSGKASQRRKAEDAAADGENAVFQAQSDLDAAAAAKRRGSGAQAAVDEGRAKLARLQDQLRHQQTELRRVEAQQGMPLPTQGEGQFNVARAELSAARAGLEKMRIRAPAAGAVLQVSAKVGEIVGLTSAQPLLLFGNLSTLRVRAEVDELDFSEVHVGDAVLVRASAFPDREFPGKVSFIAPILGAPQITPGAARDANVVEVFADLPDPGPLVVGMKVDVYFMGQAQNEPTH